MITNNIQIDEYCPNLPDYAIDFSKLEKDFSEEVQAMSNCMQNPFYHMEGDVWTHTKMVLEALVSLNGWQKLSIPHQTITFMASFLHDVGKPSMTRIEDDGKISSRGHGGRGAKIARVLLSEHFPDLSVKTRESIVQLVKAHAVAPNSFRNDPKRIAIRASHTTNCLHLYLMATADAMGRRTEIEDDLKESLNNTELFRMICEENNCLDVPYKFPSDHTRFFYFKKENVLPEYEIYDDTKFQVILMAGLPGAGKDHYINNNVNLPIVSLDNIRELMGVKATDNQGAVGQEATERAKIHLRKKESFCFNATSLTLLTRTKLIDLFYRYGASTQIVYIEPPLSVLHKQNESRKRVVPWDIISKLLYKMDFPTDLECHDLRLFCS